MPQVWEEVKRLAVDFQKAQLSSTSQRLSERNCIELISKLTTLSLLQVVYTTDGKSYITPQHLLKEIADELEVRSGRVSIADISQSLGVDFSQVESKAYELASQEPSVHLLMGQLLHSSYLNHIAEEMNDKLQEQGQIKMGALAKEYDLPTDFIASVVNKRLGTLITGQCDSNDKFTVFTEGFVRRHKACIRGLFTAITRPTPVAQVLNRKDFQERLSFTLLEKLIDEGRLPGALHGGRHIGVAVYVPEAYTRAQQRWVTDFYEQNGYIEYSALLRLGINEPQQYVTRRFPQALALRACCVGLSVTGALQDAVDEALAAGSYLDVATLVPPVLTADDIQLLAERAIRGRSGASVLGGGFAVSDLYVRRCSEQFMPLLEARAQQVLREQPGVLAGDVRPATSDSPVDLKQERREQRRRKAASGKAGGGQQGRETKTKAVKRKTVKPQEEPEETSQQVQFLSEAQILQTLTEIDEDCPEALKAALGEHLHEPLEMGLRRLLHSLIVHRPPAGSQQRRIQVVEQLQSLVAHLSMFERGLKHFADDTQQQLSRHLLRSLGADVCNLLVCTSCADQRLEVPKDGQFSAEERGKLIQHLPTAERKALSALHASLSKGLVEFWAALEASCADEALNIMLKKVDKRKERQLAFTHRQSLCDQVRAESEPASLLHLAVSLLFQNQTGCPLLAPGKCVPLLLSHVMAQYGAEHRVTLQRFHELLQKQLRRTDEPEVEAQLAKLVPSLKELALARKAEIGEKGPSRY